MDNWLLYGADEIDALALQDPVFQQMLAQHDRLVSAFDALMESLPDHQRELILEYLNLQLDMEAWKTRLAWGRSEKIPLAVDEPRKL